MDLGAVQNSKALAKIKSITGNKLVMRILQVILLSAAIGLAVYSLKRHGGSINISKIDPGLLAGAFFVYLVFFVFFAAHWAYSLYIIEKQKIEWRQSLAFLASQPYKYLPTSAFSISARSIYSKKIGAHSIGSTAKAQLVENGSFFASGLVIIALAKSGINLDVLLPLAVLIIISLFAWNFRAKEIKQQYRYLTLVSIATAGWLVSGLSLYLALHSVGLATSYREAVYLNAATFLASIAAVLVPAGIGVREAILFSQNISLTGTLLLRVISIVADLVCGIAAIYKIDKPKKN